MRTVTTDMFDGLRNFIHNATAPKGADTDLPARVEWMPISAGFDEILEMLNLSDLDDTAEEHDGPPPTKEEIEAERFDSVSNASNIVRDNLTDYMIIIEPLFETAKMLRERMVSAGYDDEVAEAVTARWLSDGLERSFGMVIAG